jgi:hypothetical protein
MFVGGPNVRKDYHFEEGEEVLFMSNHSSVNHYLFTRSSIRLKVICV